MFSFVLDVVAYCVVAVESAGRQIPIAFLERVKEEFSKKYGGGKAATATTRSLNKEFGYFIFNFYHHQISLTYVFKCFVTKVCNHI